MWSGYLSALRAPGLRLELPPACSGALACFFSMASGPGGALVLPAPGFYAAPVVELPSLQLGSSRGGGFVNMDVMEEPRLIIGPEVSWLTPESPREDLLRLRVVSPGWGVRYNFDEAHVSVGVAACARFLTFGEDLPVVDVLTSEARIEFRLP